jgi:hypothetical protein
VVHDTTHYPAFSARTAVPIPAPLPDQAPKARRVKKDRGREDWFPGPPSLRTVQADFPHIMWRAT